MTGDRLTVALDPAYAAAIGLAVYCFASLEWWAVRCCEALDPGSMDDLSERTAGRVGDTLVALSSRLDPSPGQAELLDAASDFRGLVATRNNLVHSRPGETEAGEPALFRHGDQWTRAELEGVADLFAACAARLERALQAMATAA